MCIDTTCLLWVCGGSSHEDICISKARVIPENSAKESNKIISTIMIVNSENKLLNLCCSAFYFRGISMGLNVNCQPTKKIFAVNCQQRVKHQAGIWRNFNCQPPYLITAIFLARNGFNNRQNQTVGISELTLQIT